MVFKVSLIMQLKSLDRAFPNFYYVLTFLKREYIYTYFNGLLGYWSSWCLCGSWHHLLFVRMFLSLWRIVGIVYRWKPNRRCWCCCGRRRRSWQHLPSQVVAYNKRFDLDLLCNTVSKASFSLPYLLLVVHNRFNEAKRRKQSNRRIYR